MGSRKVLERQACGRPVIRPMVEDDTGDVLAIERGSFERPWSAKDFKVKAKDHDRRFTIVASCDEQVVGYACYEWLPDRVFLCRLAVTPECRRAGIATALVRYLTGHVTPGRPCLTAVVPERWLEAQLLFKTCLMKVEKIHRGCYGPDAGYEMVFRRERAAG